LSAKPTFERRPKEEREGGNHGDIGGREKFQAMGTAVRRP
jgi:hypothetical protein